MRLAPRWFAASLVALATACAAQSSGRNSGRTDASLITRDQIAAVHSLSAYEIVEALHSNWLRPHGPDSFQNPSVVLVYLDDARLGGVETLRAISPPTIAWIRFYDGVTAQARWGVGHAAGVIFVATQVGP